MRNNLALIVVAFAIIVGLVSSQAGIASVLGTAPVVVTGSGDTATVSIDTCATGEALVIVAGAWVCGSSGHTVQDEAIDLADQPDINFTGAGVVCADNAGAGRTDCTITGVAGSGVQFDLGNDDVIESTGITEVNVTGDTNSIFTETPADQILIDLTNAVPTADLATTATALAIDPADCPANQFADVIAANGDLSCNGVVDADVSDTLTIDNGSTVDPDAISCDVGDDDLISEDCIGDVLDESEIEDIYLLNSGDVSTGDLLIDDGQELRIGEPDGAGTEYIAIVAPATLAANRTCTLEDDATPFDPCVSGAGGGDITAVGPGHPTGEAFTDGVASTGTDLLIWEGTGIDGNELTISGPANPAVDQSFTFPDDNIADDDVLLGSGAGTFGYSAVADCNNSNVDRQQYDTATNLFTCDTDIFVDADVADAISIDNSSSGTIILEQGTGPFNSTTGRIQWNTDDDRIVVGNGATSNTFFSGAHTTDNNTNASTECAGTTTYYDGEGGCDDISSVYVNATGDVMVGSYTVDQISWGVATELVMTEPGSITVTESFHRIDTFADAGSDQLNDIVGGTEGDYLILRAEDTNRSVQVQDNAGTGVANIQLAGNTQFILDSGRDILILLHNGSTWTEISRSNNETAEEDDTHHHDSSYIADAADVINTSHLDDGADVPGAGECLVVAVATTDIEYITCPGGGSAITFDIGDDAGDDSVDVNEIATTGDTNTIFTEPSADKILIAVGNNWPTADTAEDLTCTNCINATEIEDLYVLIAGDAIAGDLDFNDGVTDSPKATFTPATGVAWDIFTDDGTDDLEFEVTSAATENVNFSNTGAGIVTVTIDSLATGGAAECLEADTSGVISITGAGCGSGAPLIVQDGDVTITAAANTIDFEATVFTVTDSPAGEANVAIAADSITTTLMSDAGDSPVSGEFLQVSGTPGNIFYSAIDDADVPDTITVSNYLPLAGGTLTGDLLIDDGVADTPKITFTPATGTAWDIFTDDGTDDLEFQATTASAENIFFNNTGAGSVTVTIDSLATGGANECLEADTSGTIVLTGGLCGSGGSSEWTDTGTALHPNETADEVVIGSTGPVNSAKLSIDGDADQQQFVIQAFAGQASELFVIEASDGTDLVDVNANGEVDIHHTAIANEEIALELDVNADGFSDVKALDIQYTTGNISAGEEEAVILINIDESGASGGTISGIEIISTSFGTDTVEGIEIGVGINPLLHESGSFEDVSFCEETSDDAAFVDCTAAFNDAGTDILIWDADDDRIYLGEATTFEEIAWSWDTVATSPGIQPTFEYWSGAAWDFFGPIDGTLGARFNGVMIWNSDDLAGWAATTVDGDSAFWIRITRTANSMTGPTEDLVKNSVPIDYMWAADGSLLIKDIEFEGTTDDAFQQLINTTDPTADRTFTLPDDQIVDDDIIVADGSGTIQYLALPDCNASTDHDLQYDQATNAFTCDSTADATGTDNQSLFETINATSGTDPVADSATDTLNLAAGTGVTVTGDSGTDTVTFAATLGTAITTGEITDDEILEVDLDAVDAAVDEECLTFETDNSGFEWQDCGVVAEVDPTLIDDSAVTVGDGVGGNVSLTFDGDAGADGLIRWDVTADIFDFDLGINIDNAGGGDSSDLIFTPGTGTVWTEFVENAGDDLQLEVNTASTETFDIANAGAGQIDIILDGLLTAGDFDCSDCLEATDIAADAINLAELNDGADTPGVGECLVVDGTGVFVEYITCPGASQDLFETIGVDNGTDPVADSAADTLNLVSGTGATVTGDETTDTITIATTLGVAIDAGEITAAAIDGDDINSNVAGRSLTLTAASPDTLDADPELYTFNHGIWFEDPTDVDDFESIWTPRTDATITKLWCESDQTVTMMLLIDDGGPLALDTVDLICLTTPDTDDALDGADAGVISAGESLDLSITSVSGTPTWVSIMWEGTYND